jgi:hypothetical protein
MATTAIAAARVEAPSSKLIAPWGHTASIAALFLGTAVSGAFFQRHAQSAPGMLHRHPQVVLLYLSLIAMEWGLVVWRKVDKRQRCARGCWLGAGFMGGLGDRRPGVESLVRCRPCRVHPDFLAATSIGNSPLDWRFHHRRILRRAGLSRLLPETIRDLYPQPVDRIVPAGCAVRRCARLSGIGSVREDRVLRRPVWLARGVARKPAARHDGACRGGYSQWHLRNLTAFP